MIYLIQKTGRKGPFRLYEGLCIYDRPADVNGYSLPYLNLFPARNHTHCFTLSTARLRSGKSRSPMGLPASVNQQPHSHPTLHFTISISFAIGIFAWHTCIAFLYSPHQTKQF